MKGAPPDLNKILFSKEQLGQKKYRTILVPVLYSELGY